jgi:YVTN family beta-propeller protein
MLGRVTSYDASAGVWVMNQSDGSVSHIDPNTDRVVETIEVDDTGISGGDLTVAEGSV